MAEALLGFCAYTAATKAPMDVPVRRSIDILAFSISRRIPKWASPLAPPPPSATPILKNLLINKKRIISQFVGEDAFLPGESWPGSSSGPKQGRDPSLPLAGLHSLPKPNPSLPRLPLRKPTKLHLLSPFPPVLTPPGEPDPDSFPLPSLATAGLRIGIAKAGYLHSDKLNPLSLLTAYSRDTETYADENLVFLSDPGISEATRRIPGEHHYLFWYPEPQSCRRHRTPMNFPISLAILEV